MKYQAVLSSLKILFPYYSRVLAAKELLIYTTDIQDILPGTFLFYFERVCECECECARLLATAAQAT